MRKDRAVGGIVLIIVGLIISAVYYPVIGCQDAGDCAQDLEEEFSGLSGLVDGAISKEVKFTGTVNGVWTDDVPGLDVAFDLIGLSVITISDFDIDYKFLGLFEDTASILIFADNTELNEGDAVYVNGYAMGSSSLGMVIVIGDDSLTSIVNFALMSDPPETANVDKVPRPGCYIGLIVGLIGFVAFLSSTAVFNRRPKQPKTQHYYQYQSYHGYQYHQYQQQQQQPAPHFERRPTQPPPLPPLPAKEIEKDDASEEKEESHPTTPPPPRPPMAKKIEEKEELPVAMPAQTAQYPCRTCRQSLKYIDQYQRWYCEFCRRYV
jgi:hypothetical protein